MVSGSTDGVGSKVRVGRRVGVAVQQSLSTVDAGYNRSYTRPVLLTGGVFETVDGQPCTTFQFSSDLADHNFAIGQLRSAEPPWEEIPRPEISLTGLDEVIIRFWLREQVPDNSVQVWLHRV